MDKNFKGRIAFEVIIILGALVLFCLIVRLWPLVFLVIPGILIAAIRLLSLSSKKNAEIPPQSADMPIPKRPENEQDVVRIAFGVLQLRVTEAVISRYPDARWVWGVPNSIDRFANNLPLTILLNKSGGYGRAEVQTNCLRFAGLVFPSLESPKPDVPPREADNEGDPDSEYMTGGNQAVDYALIAFQWVEANLLTINSRCNEAIAEKRTTILIPACELPHQDSWPGVCSELMRNEFIDAEVQPDGISVELPK